MHTVKLKRDTSVIEWLDSDVSYEEYEQDAEIKRVYEGEDVEVLKEAKSNITGKNYVVYSERVNEAFVINEVYLDWSE